MRLLCACDDGPSYQKTLVRMTEKVTSHNYTLRIICLSLILEETTSRCCLKTWSNFTHLFILSKAAL